MNSQTDVDNNHRAVPTSMTMVSRENVNPQSKHVDFNVLPVPQSDSTTQYHKTNKVTFHHVRPKASLKHFNIDSLR